MSIKKALKHIEEAMYHIGIEEDYSLSQKHAMVSYLDQVYQGVFLTLYKRDNLDMIRHNITINHINRREQENKVWESGNAQGKRRLNEETSKR